MSTEHNAEWVVVETVGGTLQAEILRGLLEAQGVEVVLSQEGAGHFAYAATVGRLGQVDLLVPPDQADLARQVLEDFRAGKFESSEFPEE